MITVFTIDPPLVTVTTTITTMNPAPGQFDSDASMAATLERLS